MTETRPIAVQLYTLREELSADFDGVMAQVAQMGYIGVEAFGGLPAGTLKAKCDALGLQVISAHLPNPVGDTQTQTLKDAETLGIKRIVIPYLPPERFSTEDSVKRVAEELNTGLQVAQANGYQLGYHNHDFEFQKVGDRFAYDILLDNLAPEVFMEVDTYWVQVGGGNVVALLERLGERVPLLHVKDGSTNKDDPMTAVGGGKMDFEAIIPATKAEWMIVELDRCATDMLEAVRQSYIYLTEKGLAHGKTG